MITFPGVSQDLLVVFQFRCPLCVCFLPGSFYFYLFLKNFILFILKALFTYLFLASLSPCCSTRTFSSCGKWRLLFSCGAWVSYCGGFSCCRAWSLACWGFSNCCSQPLVFRFNSCGAQGLVALWHVASSQTRDRTCIGRQILYH